MNFLDSTRIGQRLGLACAAVILLATMVVLISISRLSAITASLTLSSNDRLLKVEKLVEINDNVNLVSRELRNALIWEDAAKVAAALDAATNARDAAAALQAALLPSITAEEDKKRAAVMVETLAAYLLVQQKVVELVAAGQKPEATVLLNEQLQPKQLAYMKALEGLNDLQIEFINQAAKDGKQNYAQAKLLMFALLAGMVATGMLLACLMSRAITGPAEVAVTVA